MTMRKPALRSRKGFSLLAVMIALILLGVGVLALARTQTIVTSIQGRAATRTVELAIARGYMEVLRGRDASTIVPESATLVDADGQASATGPYTRTVDVVTLSSNLKRVTVSVQMPHSGGPIVLETLIYVRSA
jgi:Tfp pilus assembly protein PilV